jgi:hypothetical protein
MTQTAAPQPPKRRVLSLIWFPFFFAAAFSSLLLLSFSSPAPHGLSFGVVGSQSQVSAVQTALDRAKPGGFVVTGFAQPAQLGAALTSNSTIAGLVVDPAGPQLWVASAGGASRANYLKSVVAATVVPALGESTLTTVDVVPVLPGDGSGVGVFFYGLPLLLVGMITSIVLLQFGMWPIWKKATTIAAAGAFASAFTFAAAVLLDVLPVDGWLLLYGFALTQAIGLLTTGLAYFVKQFFLPAAMTFVLILGIPSAGGTVNGDMLPGFVGWLNSFMPFAQLVDITRASAYFDNHNLFRPLLVLLGWVILGAAVLGLARARMRAAASSATSAIRAAAGSMPVSPIRYQLTGRVTTTSRQAIAGATVRVLDDNGDETLGVTTDTDGNYEITALPVGLHHLVAMAPHCEPEIYTVVVQSATVQDIEMLDWNDPSGNLTAEELDTRRSLTRRDGNAGRSRPWVVRSQGSSIELGP